MHIQNIAGYRFVTLSGLPALRQMFLETCQALGLKGTILLSEEGINIQLSGQTDSIQTFKVYLQTHTPFHALSFRESYSDQQVFKRLKVKIKKEIICLRRPELRPEDRRVPTISPQTLKAWLDEDRALQLLDTRNDYEVRYGTFKKAQHLNLADFGDFIQAAESVARGPTPIVIFCTGGIRCEKAGLHLLNLGHPEVYQLEGGILNYFAVTGSAHYQGSCFVFDDRTSVNEKLQPGYLY